MTDDPVAFLRDRLDEDKRIALAATWHEDAGTWTAEASPYGVERRQRQGQGPRWFIVDSMDDGVITDVDPQASETEGVATHIARHDPARVLREVDAKREELALHRPEPGQHPDFCGYDKHQLPCPSLRLLALPFADHPDYRQEWQPGA